MTAIPEDMEIQSIKRCDNSACEPSYALVEKDGAHGKYLVHVLKCTAEGCDQNVTLPHVNGGELVGVVNKYNVEIEERRRASKTRQNKSA